MNFEDFKPHEHSFFTLTFQDDEKIKAKLKEVTPILQKEQPESARKPFSLLFEIEEQESYVGQGSYQLRHPHLGELILFLVPIGPGGKSGMIYEAIFN